MGLAAVTPISARADPPPYYNPGKTKAMKGHQKAICTVLLALLAVALTALFFTRNRGDYLAAGRAVLSSSRQPSGLVETRPLDTAEQLAPLAVAHTEQEYAWEALRLGDHSVDLAFDAAMRDAAENPTPVTPQTRELSARIKAADATVAADEDRVTNLTQQLAKARGSEKDSLMAELGVAQAQVALDRDELEDAHQDLIRAGGDKQATIGQQLDQHEASDVHSAILHPGEAGNHSPATPSIELTQSKSVVAQFQAWLSLRSKANLLIHAQQEARTRIARLSASHEASEKELHEEKSQKKILHRHGGSLPLRQGEENQSGSPQSSSALALIDHLSTDQKNLSALDKRIETEQQLAALYGNWSAFVGTREEGYLHGLCLSVCWILLIALFVVIANYWVQRLFASIASEHRQLHTIRALLLFVVQALGLLFILLVIVGIPSNLATVLALAGAGLTVAMKDFIVGFFGWFILMGKNGIRVTDWVEINGVGGEVIEVGFLHTVLLETGGWTEVGHPTGRRVSFVNSFAIEGHYFNFSTSGQWLWDEIEVQISDSSEPYAVAEAIQKIAGDETAANAKLAEAEWNRVTPSYRKRSFSAIPSLSVRPTGSGVEVLVRYITRVDERHRVRARIYRAVVELLHGKQIPESAASPGKPGAAAAFPEPVPNRA